MEAGAKFIFAAYGFGDVDADTPVINEFSELVNVADEVLG
jgi:phosphoglycolate phosphatase